MRNAFLEYKSDLKELVAAYKVIRLSDAFINILPAKIDQTILRDKKLDKILADIVKVYPDKYIKDLFIVKLITLLEQYLKKRLTQEFNANEASVRNFLLKYNSERKLGVNDVIEGPQKLAISYLDDILFHNLPKVERIYFLTFNFDIKKFCDFKRLITIVKMRHLIVHDGGKDKSNKKIETHRIQTCLDEVDKLIENIEYSIIKGRPKKVIKRIEIDNYGSSHLDENLQALLDYEMIKVFGE